MKPIFVIAFLLLPAAAWPADAPPAAKPLCVRAREGTDYNARPVSHHDVLVQNAIGDRRPVRASTTCIHIWPDSFVAVRSQFTCLAMGDDVSVRTIDGHGERCKISKVAPYVEGSAEAGYK